MRCCPAGYCGSGMRMSSTTSKAMYAACWISADFRSSLSASISTRPSAVYAPLVQSKFANRFFARGLTSGSTTNAGLRPSRTRWVMRWFDTDRLDHRHFAQEIDRRQTGQYHAHDARAVGACREDLQPVELHQSEIAPHQERAAPEISGGIGNIDQESCRPDGTARGDQAIEQHGVEGHISHVQSRTAQDHPRQRRQESCLKGERRQT